MISPSLTRTSQTSHRRLRLGLGLGIGLGLRLGLMLGLWSDTSRTRNGLKGCRTSIGFLMQCDAYHSLSLSVFLSSLSLVPLLSPNLFLPQFEPALTLLRKAVDVKCLLLSVDDARDSGLTTQRKYYVGAVYCRVCTGIFQSYARGN